MSRSSLSYRREIAKLQSMIAAMLWVQPTSNSSPSCANCGVQQHLHRDHCSASKLVAACYPEDDEVRQRAVRMNGAH